MVPKQYNRLKAANIFSAIRSSVAITTSQFLKIEVWIQLFHLLTAILSVKQSRLRFWGLMADQSIGKTLKEANIPAIPRQAGRDCPKYCYSARLKSRFSNRGLEASRFISSRLYWMNSNIPPTNWLTFTSSTGMLSFSRSIKTTLGMNVLRCKTPLMVNKKVVMHFIVYNCIRGLMPVAASESPVKLRKISFKGSSLAIILLTSVLASYRSP